MLDCMMAELTEQKGVVNAWAMEWENRFTKQWDRIMLEALAMLDVDLANVGNRSTLNRNDKESIIDVSFLSPGLTSSSNWREDDAYVFETTTWRFATVSTTTTASCEQMKASASCDEQVHPRNGRPHRLLLNSSYYEPSPRLSTN